MQKRAARAGFDWPDIHPVWKKLSEEIDEVQDALERGDMDAIEDELGDLLFTVVNLSRHLAIDPENALRRSTRKFEKRFRCVEKLAQDKNLGLLSLNDSELDALWEVAKREAEKA
jgi:nucleoside triphosphate diphosphatase